MLAYNKQDETWYRVSYESCDNVFISDIHNFSMDVPREYGCVRIWFNSEVRLTPPASSVIGQGK